MATLAKERRVKLLHPEFIAIVEQIVAFAASQGCTLRIVETLRNLARQGALLTGGATLLKLGWHQFGLAFDFLLYEADGTVINNGKDPRYLLIGAFAESLGCRWGGRWDIQPQVPGQQPDSGHLEWHPGFTIQSYQAALAHGPVTFVRPEPQEEA